MSRSARLLSIRMRDWLRMAFEGSVVRRGVLYTVVVGSALVGINHGDAILHGDVGRGRLLRIALTVLVPYCVSTSSGVAAISAMGGSQGQAGGKERTRG